MRTRVCTREMEIIDWTSLASFLKKNRWSTRTYRLMWEDNPCKAKLFRQGRAHSPDCHLCGRKDDIDHFTSCQGINAAKEWGDLKATFQTRSGVLWILGYLVRTATSELEGAYINHSTYVGLQMNLFKEQDRIGWKNLIRGRIHGTRHELQDKLTGEERVPPATWQFGLVTWLLEILQERRNLICALVVETDRTKERDSLIREFERMESIQEWKEPREMDAYLASPQNRPGAATSLEVMRELVRTSKVAVKVVAVREMFP